MESITKQPDFLTGTEGEYLGIKYKWTKDAEDHQLLILIDGNKETVVWKTKKLLTDPEMATTYQNVVNDYIEFYLEDKKLDAELEKMVKNND